MGSDFSRARNQQTGQLYAQKHYGWSLFLVRWKTYAWLAIFGVLALFWAAGR